jgi:autotransporter translocation and assembly factor TamB
LDEDWSGIIILLKGLKCERLAGFACRDEFPKRGDILIIKIFEISELVDGRVNVAEFSVETRKGGHQAAEKTRHAWKDSALFVASRFRFQGELELTIISCVHSFFSPL